MIKPALEFWVNKVGIPVATIVKQTGLDRNTLYKYLSGRYRTISPEDTEILRSYFINLQKQIGDAENLWKNEGSVSKMTL